MILIVNSTFDDQISKEVSAAALERELDIEVIEAAPLKISHCIGCNHCWLKTPGECSVKDDYEIILKKVIHADQMWVISDTALGFIDHKGKNIFDRILPICTMYLKFKGDQMRHVMRYDKKTDIGLIITGEADRDYLKRWSERAALNFGSRSLGVFNRNEIKEAVSCM
ncbi:MAG: flavodoxin family protein [Lachnospiraceae bacterium]|nr:flavodoxin family protein [Lachnospiraceae bacterium]